MKKPIQEVAYFFYELDAYKIFVEMSERHWIEEYEKYNLSLHTDNSELMHRFDYRSDLSANLSTEFPQYQRKSYLIMLLSIFEDFLNQLCISVKLEYKLNISYVDFAGKGIDRAKDYLNKATPLNFTANSKEWNKIKKAQLIRNIVVHAAGHMDPIKHKKELVIVSSEDFLESKSYARIHLLLSREYILELISDLKLLNKQLLVLSEALPNP